MIIKTIKRKISFTLCCLAIISLLYGCGNKTSDSANSNLEDEHTIENEVTTNEIVNFENETSKTQDSTLALMVQRLEVPGCYGRYYSKLAVTSGNNELVKNVIDNSMGKLEEQASEIEGNSFVNVYRNDDKLISYYSGFTTFDHSFTYYGKTINVVDGSELELSDIITNMDMLPRAMYAECCQVRDDYDDFIEYVGYMIDNDLLGWSVNNDGIVLVPDNEYTASILSRGTFHPVNYYGFSVFLSYSKYPDLFNSLYFSSNRDNVLNILGNSTAALSDEQFRILEENDKNGDTISYGNILCYSQDMNIALYLSYPSNSSIELCIYDFDNEISCVEKIDDDIYLNATSIPYIANVKGNNYLIYSIAYTKYENEEEKYFSNTFVFKIDDNKVTLADRVDSMMNLGGGELSPNGFYMNSFEQMYVYGPTESEWNSTPMYMLTDKGKIVLK